ncbi:hypothetical protein BT96DRAFT_475744 [Gymnopus androsaceus JB14]|uniref:C2H2-type domain-containing protein n=1 Tax=Gymnopus androsaceus JB14 TaxID=1447944 RepID=A0A6A4GPP3_9AGAR|nr:hypothetical protein BT96DRAFT_475744 [Gymnopus androsaceus JB14]
MTQIQVVLSAAHILVRPPCKQSASPNSTQMPRFKCHISGCAYPSASTKNSHSRAYYHSTKVTYRGHEF